MFIIDVDDILSVIVALVNLPSVSAFISCSLYLFEMFSMLVPLQFCPKLCIAFLMSSVLQNACACCVLAKFVSCNNRISVLYNSSVCARGPVLPPAPLIFSDVMLSRPIFGCRAGLH